MKKRASIMAIVTAAALLGAIAVYIFNSRRSAEPIELSRERYPISGLDFSSHNGVIDFDRLVDDSIDFVILKATEGTTFKDPRFNANYRNARRAGIPVIGVYHFFRFDTDGEMQAINFLNSLRGKTLDLPAVIDLEEWTNPTDVDTEEVVCRLRAMIAYLERNGHNVMFYTNKDGWICSFTDPPLDELSDDRWDLWQYSHHGWTEACDTKVDLNTFNGSRDEWLNWLRASTF